jgi:hypothetical protein
MRPLGHQDGTLNGLFRNDGTRFVDVAHELRMDADGRPANFGSNGPSVIDYDNDGRLDLFVAGYGRNFLYRNDGGGTFTDVAAPVGVAGGDKATPSSWGDYDNDGHPDLYVSSYVDRPVNERDYLYHNEGGLFRDVLPSEFAKRGATHGIQWVDFDGDGALDLAIANNNPDGNLSLSQFAATGARPALSSSARARRQRPLHASRLRSANLRPRHTQGPRQSHRRHRQRLLLAERDAGALWSGERDSSRRRGDVAHQSGAKDHEGGKRRSQQIAEASAGRQDRR